MNIVFEDETTADDLADNTVKHYLAPISKSATDQAYSNYVLAQADHVTLIY
jgi:hypothetical protein